MDTANTYQPLLQSKAKQWLIVSLLLAIMIFTRIGYLSHVQDASWAVIFLIGFYLRNYIGIPIVILSAVVIDFAMIAARGGHQDFYLTPSYLFVIPAYAALWFAGRYLANHYSENLKGLIIFVGVALLGIVSCDLISSGGFYWMASDSVQISIPEFFSRTLEFMPSYLKTLMFYLSIAAFTHLAFVHAGKIGSNKKTT